MAEIDDALPNTPVSDEAFVEQEVAIPGQDLPKDPQKPEVIMDEMGGAEISFDPRLLPLCAIALYILSHLWIGSFLSNPFTRSILLALTPSIFGNRTELPEFLRWDETVFDM